MGKSAEVDALRRVADHVEETRRRLAEGEAEIRRQRDVVAETKRHLSGMSRWIEETERHLGEHRAVEEPRDDDLPPAA